MVPQQSELGQPRRHGHRVPTEGPGLINRAQGAHLLHNRPSSTVGAHRHSRADDFSKGHQIRLHAKISHCPCRRQTEAGDHLVEQQQAAVSVAQLPQALEKALRGKHHAHIGCHRLYHHAGHRIRIGLKQRLHTGQIIVLRRQRVRRAPGRNPGAAGHPGCHDAGTGLHQKAIAVPVVAALKLDDFIPPGIAPGRPNGAHHRLGTGVHHADHLQPRYHPAHQTGHLHLQLCGRAIAESPGGGLRHRLSNLRPVMSQKHGAPGTDIVDIPVAVHVGQISSVGPGDKPGAPANRGKGPNRAIDSTGDPPPGLLK